MFSYFSRILLFILIMLPRLVLGEIRETISMDSILKYVQDETLVIADIDNTLIESETQLGSSQWGDYLGDLYTDPCRSFEEVDALVAEIWCKVQPLIKIRCVDPQTEKVFQQLQKQNTSFIVLTARRPCEINYTYTQLLSVGIKATSHIIEDGFLDNASDISKRIICYQGIIFCTPINKKSKSLKLFLEKSGHHPKRIIFIDDKLSHVKDVGQLVESLGIDYIGIHFRGSDERVLAFCPEISKIQFDHLPKIITDDEASLIFKTRQKSSDLSNKP